MRRNQCKNYKMGTYEINKISFSFFDDRTFVLSNGINTLAYFYKDLKMDSHRWSQIQRIQKNSHKKKRFSQMITNKNKCVQINSR